MVVEQELHFDPNMPSTAGIDATFILDGDSLTVDGADGLLPHLPLHQGCHADKKTVTTLAPLRHTPVVDFSESDDDSGEVTLTSVTAPPHKTQSMWLKAKREVVPVSPPTPTCNIKSTGFKSLHRYSTSGLTEGDLQLGEHPRRESRRRSTIRGTPEFSSGNLWHKAFIKIKTERVTRKWLKSRGGTRLIDLLESARGVTLFESFLAKEYSEENLLFYLECDTFLGVSEQNLAEEADKIIQTFVLDSGERQVNLDYKTVSNIKRQRELGPHVQMFEDAQNVVYKLMATDAFPRFRKTPLYGQFVDEKLAEEKQEDAEVQMLMSQQPPRGGGDTEVVDGGGQRRRWRTNLTRLFFSSSYPTKVVRRLISQRMNEKRAHKHVYANG